LARRLVASPSAFVWAVIVTLLGGASALLVHAENTPGLRIGVTALPAAVGGGRRVTFQAVVHNDTPTDASDAVVTHVLPEGFRYVPGTTRLRTNGQLVSRQDPLISGNTLTWGAQTVPASRADGVYGMHTFVQDHCDTAHINQQLDWVVHAAGPGAYVKQLLYRIDASTQGPSACWVEFVNGCYDRGLTPIVRLQGHQGSGVWTKPSPDPNGSYTSLAQAYARVVAGLPKRDGQPLYVEVWNEPNLDIEWGGRADPAEYARFLVDVAAAIRALGDARVRILNGGLSPGGDIPPEAFIDGMATVPGSLWAFDVWAAHPYSDNRPPEQNIHDGTATVYRNLTIDSYLLELDRLALHGRSGLQVLITEAGYALGQDGFWGILGLPPINEPNRADYISRAFRDYWSAWPEVLGVCPFQLYDPDGVWADWDWYGHQQYHAVAALPKTPSPVAGELRVQFQAVADGPVGERTARAKVTSPGFADAQATTTVVLQSAPTPTPMPQPTATPLPQPTTCAQAIVNGGFEADEAWELPLDRARYSSAYSCEGTRSMLVGLLEEDPVTQWSSARQAIELPTDAVAVRIEFAAFPICGDPSRGKQRLLVFGEDSQDPSRPVTVAVLHDQCRDDVRWGRWSYDLPYALVREHAGKRIWVQFTAVNDGYAAAVTAMFVDDVRVEICRATGAPPPTVPPRPPAPVWLPLIMRGYDHERALREWVYLPLIVRQGTGKAAVGPGVAAPPEADGTQEGERVERPPEATVLGRIEDVVRAPERVSALYDEARRRLLVATRGTLLALDGRSGRELFRAALDGPVGSLAVDAAAGTVWATLPDVGRVQSWGIDGREGPRLEGLGRPTGLEHGTGRLYVADSGSHRVLAYDAARGAILAEHHTTLAPYALAHDSGRDVLYAGEMGSGRVLALDGATLELRDELQIPGLGYPTDLEMDVGGSRLYVAHNLTPKFGALSVIDTESWTLLDTLSGDYAQPLTGTAQVVAVEPEGALLLRWSGGLATVDAREWRVVSAVRRPAAERELAVAADRRTGAVYTVRGDGLLRVETWSKSLPR